MAKIIKYVSLFLLSIIFLVISLVFIFLFSGANIPGRPLTDNELKLAKFIYTDNINYAKIRIVFDSIYCTISPLTLGNIIHIKSSWTKLDPALDLTQTFPSRNMLIHELEHVNQYQHEGWSYAIESLVAQIKGSIFTGSRNGAYNWRQRVIDKTPWEKWNPEEQAQSISDYEYYLESGTSQSLGVAAPVSDLGCFVPVLKKTFCKF